MDASRSTYALLEAVSPPTDAGVRRVLPDLVDGWCDDYRLSTGRGEISEVRLAAQHERDQAFSYLFDHDHSRIIASYGFSGQRNTIERREADRRLKGHPRVKFSHYDRGHLISHLLGGGADINIFRQERVVNRGDFQRLEQLALGHPGSFYFVHLIYDRADTQTPSQVEQGVVLDLGHRARLEYKLYGN